MICNGLAMGGRAEILQVWLYFHFDTPWELKLFDEDITKCHNFMHKLTCAI